MRSRSFVRSVLTILTLAVMPLRAAALEEPELVYEFSTVPGEDGQPNFGRPFLAAASPDGKHLYVVTFPAEVPSGLLTFERVGQSLALRDSVSLADLGIGGGTTDLEITEDGEYLLLAEFSPGRVHVFARDAATGALDRVQILEPFEDPGAVVDGIATSVDAAVWGRPGVPKTGGLLRRIDRSGNGISARRTRLASPAETPFSGGMVEKLPNVIDAVERHSHLETRDALTVLTEEQLLVFFDYDDPPRNGKCPLTIETLRQVVGFEEATRIKHASPVLNEHEIELVLTLDDGSRARVRLSLDDCTLSDPFSEIALPPPGMDEVPAPDHVADVPLPSEILNIGPDREIQNFNVDVGGTGDDSLYGRGGLFVFGPDGSVEDLVLFYTAGKKPIPPGRAADLAASGFVPHGGGSPLVEGSVPEAATEAPLQDAFAYATVLDPPAIRAFRLTDRFQTSPAPCTPSDTTACPNGFRVTVGWQDFQGNNGVGHVVPGGSDDSELFWFFGPSNWEMLIKVLDACGTNGHFWVFYAATTNVAFEVSVEHPDLGSKTYRNPLRQLAPAVTDTKAFSCTPAQIQAAKARADDDELYPLGEDLARWLPDPAPVESDCTDDQDTLCLTPGRFQAEVTWRDFKGKTGKGRVVPLRSDNSGLFWFFGPSNWELLVKVLDGCKQNGHYWLLAAATTNVEYTLRVTDTATQDVFEVTNPLGNPSAALVDLRAFPGCE